MLSRGKGLFCTHVFNTTAAHTTIPPYHHTTIPPYHHTTNPLHVLKTTKTTLHTTM